MKNVYYFYILECKDNTKYYGHTNNLANRLNDHLSGHVQSTKNRRPLKLIYYKEFNSRSEAFRREMQFKSRRTRKGSIEKLIKNFPLAKCQGFNSRK